MPIRKQHVDTVRMAATEIILVAFVEHMSASAYDTNHGFISGFNHADPNVIQEARVSLTNHDCFAEAVGDISEFNPTIGKKDSIRLKRMIIVVATTSAVIMTLDLLRTEHSQIV